MKTQYILYLALFSITVVTAQEKTEKKVLKKAEKEMAKSTRLSEKYTYEAVQGLEKGNPTQAEADFRKAISEDSTNIKATYNLGNTYYQQKAYDEAFLRYKQAGINNKANSSEKHKTYHNLGNVFMKAKTYDKAVEAYKEALRNNPTDEETRYNLAVAQEMLKKNPPQNDNQDNKGGGDNQNKDKNNQDNQDKNQDNQNKGNQDKNDKGDNKENKSQDNKGDDKQDKNEGNDQQNPENENKDQQGKGDEDNQNGQKQPASLSPKQMERILEAMNNEEKKVQDRINAQKVQGRPVKSDKDW